MFSADLISPLLRHNCFHKPEDVEVGMDMSLKNLDMDYGEIRHPMDLLSSADRTVVDLYLMHCNTMGLDELLQGGN